MSGEEKSLHALIDVTKIRISREQKSLTRLLVELHEVRDEFALNVQKEKMWKRAKSGWECEISGAGSLGLSDRAKASVRQKIDTIDAALARVIQRRRLLEADAKTIEDECRLKRKIILKKNVLKEIFDEKSKKAARHRLQVRDEDEV